MLRPHGRLDLFEFVCGQARVVVDEDLLQRSAERWTSRNDDARRDDSKEVKPGERSEVSIEEGVLIVGLLTFSWVAEGPF